MNEYNYTKTESWWLKSKNFNVEVKHWYSPYKSYYKGDEFIVDKEQKTHRWNVYVYVFKNHTFFDKLVENQNDNYPFLNTLHYGCTFCNWSRDEEGNVISKQYGSDYMHLHDDHFENCDSKEHHHAREIFFDAECLFDYFKDANSEIEEALV